MGGPRWQVAGDGPASAYEKYLVPAFFTGCAERLLELAEVKPGERVLDVATGTGIVARQAAARVGPEGAVTGTDVNEGMLAAAISTGPGEIEWRLADAASLPFPDGTFDLVTCQQGLQFVTDHPTALREIRRVLAPEGRVALAVWRGIEVNPAFVAVVDVLDRYVGTAAGMVLREPFAGPDRADLHRLLTAAGFRAVRVRIGLVDVRFPSAREFLRREVVSTPLAEPVSGLDEARHEEMAAELERTLAPYTDDEGIAFPLQTWLAVAGRGYDPEEGE
ncbi:methyltransferase domain-containing protein [Phytohabitans sp. ZYX-F-186]|uniref:Methyltransferase domain-containing protein n=1 Tax=Phytohabitans maris TaxID=3071409 RepID=A0ABU0ZDJ1_9ACTN|nr:methyltransferase domain-containing protein [Phytohabitans sp. ZYX-F-186]MDQ7904491.1 methyltransferase domain-containing protein [Phytohabitans sp. ZYX-F-186]